MIVAKVRAFIYVAVFMLFLLTGGVLAWGNGGPVEFYTFVAAPFPIRLGYLVILAFVLGVAFSLLMIGGYWFSARFRITRLQNQLRVSHRELQQLRNQELRQS